MAQNEFDTVDFATEFAKRLIPGTVVSLEGELGAGKTFFTRAVCRALGITQTVTSPTFVIQKIYLLPEGSEIRQLVHYDLYRIASDHELFDLGFDEPVLDGVVLAEWGDLFPAAFGSVPVRVFLQAPDDFSRLIKVNWGAE
jgi:tRNA threonylcarbamoyladenosine biosynthesis protein TsaE